MTKNLKQFVIMLIVTIVVALSLSACAPTAPVDTLPLPPNNGTIETEYVRGSRAVFAYMCGSNLETKGGAATKNIAEMLSVNLPKNTEIIIQTGGAKKWRNYGIASESSCRYQVKNNLLQLVEENPLVNMGLSSSLSDFLVWGTQKYSAEFYSVIFWDHGGGSLSGVCYDEQFNNDALSLPEIKIAFGDVFKKLGRKLEFVGFDACLMATLDTAAILAPYANYMIASEEVEPSGGWDYTALVNALGYPNMAQIGKSVCDGYMAKCKSKKKDSFATLSLIDLSAINSIGSAFNGLTAKLLGSLSEPTGAYNVVKSARTAEGFGGSTALENYSNLVDFAGFAAELGAGYKEAVTLKNAINSAVVYSVSGSQRSSANGLSIFYPVNYKRANLEKYLEICAFEGYANYLNKLYGNIPTNTIEFVDKGSKAKDGSFQISLSSASAKYIKSVDFLMIEFNVKNGVQTIYGLGQDNDISSVNGNMTYNSNFRGIWVTLNGHKLSLMPIDKGKNYIIFSAPILLNGAQTNLRFSYVFDNLHPDGGYYKMLGTWNGINAIGMADKDVVPLLTGDKVTVLYNEVNVSDYSRALRNGETFVVGEDGGKVFELPLAEEYYQYVYKVTDIFGNIFYSATAMFKMKYTYEYLLNNILPDGEFAADITVISNDVDNSLAYGA